jgi:hypothetical protein
MATRFYDRSGSDVVAVEQRDPAAFRSGVGEGLEALGQAGSRVLAQDAALKEQEADAQHRIAQLEDQRRLQSRTADGLREFDEMQTRIEQKSLELQAKLASGGEGFAEALAEFRTKESDDFLARYGDDPRLRNQFTPMVARLRGNSDIQAQGLVLQAITAKQKVDAEDFADRLYNRARSDNSPENIKLLREQAETFIGSLGPMPEDRRVAIGKSFVQRILIGQGEKLIDSDPAAALDRIESGALNDVLGAEQVEGLRTHAETELRRREAAARAEAAAAVTAQREALATRKAELATGAGTPNDHFALAKDYEAIGDSSAAVEARAKGTEMLAVQGSRDWTLPTMRAEIARLTAAQGGKDGLSPAEASRLAGLRDQYAQSQERLNRAGGALEQFAYATGKALPPVDVSKPETLRARAVMASAAAAKYGRPRVEPLLASEAEGLKQLVEGGPKERLQALQMLRGFGDPRAIEGAARQIAGKDDGGFRIAATFLTSPDGNALARDILRGPDALKAIGAAFNPMAARAAFAEHVGGALAGMGPDYAADTMAAAQSIYASTMQAAGKSEWDENIWSRSIERAMGSYRDGQWTKGGTTSFRGQQVMLPAGWTGDGVLRRIARITGEDLGKARVSGAGVWPDGSPLYTGQLREMVPVYLGGTQYGFRSPNTGRLLAAKDGGAFVLDMAKVAWR